MSCIVYSYYCLDILHSPHLRQMKNAKAVAGKNGLSIVGIESDEAIFSKKKIYPVLSLSERMEIAEAIKYVDLVVPQNEYLPFTNIKNIRPDFLMECATHNKKDIEKATIIMKSFGGKVLITPYSPLQSSTLIKDKIRNE